MARILHAIVLRFERLVAPVCKTLCDSIDLPPETEQLVNVGDGVLPPNRKERPVAEPSLTITRVDKALYLRWRERSLHAESTVREKPHNKRFFALCVCHVVLLISPRQPRLALAQNCLLIERITVHRLFSVIAACEQTLDDHVVVVVVLRRPGRS